MNHDISQPVPQGGDGTQDAENSRIAAIAKNRRDGSPDHFQDRQSKMEMQTKQVTNHNKDNGLLNMIKRTAPMI